MQYCMHLVNKFVRVGLKILALKSEIYIPLMVKKKKAFTCNLQFRFFSWREYERSTFENLLAGGIRIRKQIVYILKSIVSVVTL